MDLYLIRHAEALGLGERGITEDDERPLSEVGEQQAHLVGRSFQTRGIQLEQLIASPLLRARQTAEIIRKELASAAEVHLCPDLTPTSGMKKAARFLRSLGADRVAVVGHLPHLALWAAWLIGGKNAQIDLAKAGVAYLTFAAEPRKGTGSLVWLVRPDWLGQ